MQFLSSSFFNGMKFTTTNANTTRFILGVFNSIAFDFYEDDDFNPRTVCIFAEDVNNDTTFNCVDVEYIGNNGIPVILTYTPLGILLCYSLTSNMQACNLMRFITIINSANWYE